MHYNVKQSYTFILERHELNERAVVVDTETVCSGPTIEIIEITIVDVSDSILFERIVRPVFNRLPPLSKHACFDSIAFADAPYWADIWPGFSELINKKLLVAYNATFDRRAFSAMSARHAYASPERGWRCAMQLVKKGVVARKSLTLSEASPTSGWRVGIIALLATCWLPVVCYRHYEPVS